MDEGQRSKTNQTGVALEARGMPPWDRLEQDDGELGLIRLSALKKGETGVVYDFAAGHGLVSRMAALGFTPDARVIMVQNFGHGPVIVSIRGTRIALGRGEAEKVRIRRLDQEP